MLMKYANDYFHETHTENVLLFSYISSFARANSTTITTATTTTKTGDDGKKWVKTRQGKTKIDR